MAIMAACAQQRVHGAHSRRVCSVLPLAALPATLPLQARDPLGFRPSLGPSIHLLVEGPLWRSTGRGLRSPPAACAEGATAAPKSPYAAQEKSGHRAKFRSRWEVLGLHPAKGNAGGTWPRFPAGLLRSHPGWFLGHRPARNDDGHRAPTCSAGPLTQPREPLTELPGTFFGTPPSRN